MSPKAARPAGWGPNRAGLDDLRVAAESEASLIQNPSHAQAQRRLRRQHLARQHPSPKQSTLAREHWRALRSTRVEDLAALTAAGVGWSAITDAVPAWAKIRVDAAAFEFNDCGGEAFVLPVRTDSPTTPESIEPLASVRESWIVDLVAFHPRHPARWALLYGSAEWIGAIEPQYLDPEPVPVWRSPLSWLRADCRGLVLLGDRASQYRILTLLNSIVAEDERHAAELRRILVRPWPVPQVVSSQAEVRHAA